jgi:hypothetical protein
VGDKREGTIPIYETIGGQILTRVTMRITIRHIISIVMAGLLAGCATERVMSTGPKLAPTDPSSVKIYLSEKPNVPYEEIGRVSVDKYNNLSIARSPDDMNAALKQQAASIGGNAIIDVTEDFASMSGVVVAFKSESK